jgi:hypothetical protein
MSGVSLSRVPPPAQEPNFIPHQYLSLNWLELHVLEAGETNSRWRNESYLLMDI